MMNAVMVHSYPRQEGIDITIIDATGREIKLAHEDAAMALFVANGLLVLEVIRFREKEPVSTIHFPSPASVELVGRMK
jgi:hypothetical protein